jgi:hypothetical protein
MVRLHTAAEIYAVAEQFRERCLKNGRSLLWPDDHVWTVENITALLDAFVGNPDVSKRGFFEKWKDQLADCSPEVHKVAAHVIAVYHLLPATVSKQTKLGHLKEVVSWKLSDDPPRLEILEGAYEQSFINPSLFYLTERPS